MKSIWAISHLYTYHTSRVGVSSML